MTPPTRSGAAKPRKPQRRALSSRKALLDAALDEFAGVGFEGASTRRIAERAGVSLALIRHHFGSKQDLWKATADEVYGAFNDRLARRRRGLEGIGERTFLRLVLREYLLHFAETPQFARFVVQANHAPPALLEWVTTRFLASADDWYPALLRQGQEGGFFPRGDLLLLRFLFLGAATALFSFGPTITALSGAEIRDRALVERYVESVLHLFVGPPVIGPPRTGLL